MSLTRAFNTDRDLTSTASAVAQNENRGFDLRSIRGARPITISLEYTGLCIITTHTFTNAK